MPLTKNQRETLRRIRSVFLPLKLHLLEKFGDEANDIGDAATTVELLARTCFDYDHGSYRPVDIKRAICAYYNDQYRDPYHELMYCRVHQLIVALRAMPEEEFNEVVYDR